MESSEDTVSSLYYLPLETRRQIRRLIALYADIERKLVKFKQETQLHCLADCGICCKTACVGASVFEMQPAAVFLLDSGQAQHWQAKIDMKDERAPCVFYSPQLKNGGHCSIYPWRPLLCRLFGYSARYTKAHKLELMLCRRLKKQFPTIAQDVIRSKTAGLSGLIANNYFMKLESRSPGVAREYCNINIAWAKALERLRLYQQFSSPK